MENETQDLRMGYYVCPNCGNKYLDKESLLNHFATTADCFQVAGILMKEMNLTYKPFCYLEERLHPLRVFEIDKGI